MNFARSPAVIVTLLAVAAFAVGLGCYAAAERLYFYQHFASEAVMFACGKGLLAAVSWPPELKDFLFSQSSSFSCDHLAGVATGPIQRFAQQHYWLYITIGWIWRIFGVSYLALAPLMGLGHAIYTLGIFALTRLFFSLRTSAIVAAAFVLSAIATAVLPNLRDYLKAPFIVAGLVSLICLVRARGTARAPLYGLAAGLIIGVGTGFRTDVMVLLAGAVPALLIATAAPASTVWLRVAPAMLFGLGLAAGFWPMLSGSTTGRLGVFALQGASLPFDRHLRLAPASYDVGHIYSDDLAFSTLVADQRGHARVAEGSPTIALFHARAGSTSYFLQHYAALFPADVVTRAAKSATVLLGFYPQLRRAVADSDPGAVFPGASRVSRTGARILNALAVPWLPLLVFPGFIVLLTSVAVRDRAEAAMLSIVLLALTTVPSIQFSMRHAFHLEWLPWFGLLGYAFLPDLWKNHRRALASAALIVVGLSILAAAVWTAAAKYQQSALTRELTALLDGPRETLNLTDVTADDQVGLRIQPPGTYLVSPPPSATGRTAKPYLYYDKPSRRLLVRIGGPKCDTRLVHLRTTYSAERAANAAMEREFMVPVAPGAQDTIVIIPAFYLHPQTFEGLRVPAAQRDCVRSVESLAAETPLPAAFAAVLAPDWQARPLRLGFGSF